MLIQNNGRTSAKDRGQSGQVEILLTGLAVGLAILFLSYELYSHYSIVDDAYISFRYLDNWLDGQGLVFNPGERIEGYSNLLWIALLAPLRFVGLEVEVAATALSLIALAILLWAVFKTARNLADNAIAGWVAVILVAGSVHLARWTVSGMETVLFAALLALANQQLSEKGKNGLLSSVFFGLSTLTRLPGLMHGCLAFAAALSGPGENIRSKIKLLILPACVFILFPLLQLGFRLVYYGLPLPNTAYVKLGGNLADIIPSGLAYYWKYLSSGGGVLVLLCLLAIPAIVKKRNWVIWALAMQVAFHTAYVIYVGGDFFEFSRFIVPIVPAMAVLASIGILQVGEWKSQYANYGLPLAAVILTLLSMFGADKSYEEEVFVKRLQGRAQREMVAQWIDKTYPKEATLAVNVAGLIPYRTQRYTIDMLGLSDRHIAQVKSQTKIGDGITFVGHQKHDGVYVCNRKPDVVITGVGEYVPGRNIREAMANPGLTIFPGDREFLRAPACMKEYRAKGVELAANRYAIVYEKVDPLSVEKEQQPKTAKQWFEKGLSLMNAATMAQAASAFERSLEIVPNNNVTKTNLAYCYLRLDRENKALELFQEVMNANSRQYDALYGLALTYTKLDRRADAIAAWKRYIAEAPPSGWKGRAKERLKQLLN